MKCIIHRHEYKEEGEIVTQKKSSLPSNSLFPETQIRKRKKKPVLCNKNREMVVTSLYMCAVEMRAGSLTSKG